MVDMSLTNENMRAVLEELKKIIQDKQLACRSDDDYLTRFLQLRSCEPEKAFNRLNKYETFKTKNYENFLKINLENFQYALESNLLDMIDLKENEGTRIVWLRLGFWNPEKITADEVLQFAGLLIEIYYAMNKDDILYVKIVFDLHDFGMKHFQALSTKFAKKLIYFLTECLPARIHSIAIVREPTLFSWIYSLFKPFLNDHMKKRIKFMGHDLNVLHSYASKDVLPVELGGTNKSYNSKRWLSYLDLSIVQEELKKLCYTFK